MSKHIKIIIIAATVVLVLTAALIILLLLPQDEAKTSATSALDLISRSYLEVEEISVENSYGSYELIGFITETYNDYNSTPTSEGDEDSETGSSSSYYETMVYTMQEHPTVMLSQYQTQMLAYHCANITASKIVDKTGERYADFGLDKPRATVTITYSDNTTQTLYIGNDAVGTENTVYIRLEGDKYVYLVSNDTVSMFLEDGLQLIDTTLSISFETDAYVESMNISGSYLDAPIEIDATDSTNYDSEYLMYSPYREICNVDIMESFCETYLFDLSADRVIAADYTDDDLTTYGLDEPYSEIFVIATCGSVHLITSAPDEDNNCYIIVPGETVIYQISADSLPWLKATYRNFLSDTLFAPNITYMNCAKISVGNISYAIDIKHTTQENADDKEYTIHTVFYSGKELDYHNLENFINDICQMTRTDDSIDDAVSGSLLLKLELTYENSVTDTIAFYQLGDQALIAINDLNESYTDLNYVKDLISYVSLLVQGREVPARDMAAETAEESSEENSEAESSVESSAETFEEEVTAA